MRALLSSFLLVTPILAQDAKPAPPPAWSDKASLSLLSVGGNAQSQSLGFSNEMVRNWGTGSTLAFNLGAVRVSTTAITYGATGTSPTDYTVVRTDTTQVSSEDYFANLRFARNLSEKLLWFAGAGWERNVPSGLDSRSVVSAGLGYAWVKNDRQKFQTDLGVGYTRVKPVVETPGFQDSFGTWNLVVAYEQKIGAASAFASNLAFTDSLKDSGNFLGVWRNDLSTNLNKTLALKVGYALTYNNRPAFKTVDILDIAQVPPVVVGQAAVQLKKLDTIFSASLVLTF